MNPLDDVTAKRLERETDNTKVKPVDLLRMMIRDIERGELECDGLLLVYRHRPSKGNWDFGAYRCGLSRDEEVATLALMQEQTIRKWREQ